MARNPPGTESNTRRYRQGTPCPARLMGWWGLWAVTVALLLAAMWAPGMAKAQAPEAELDLDQLMESAQAWAKENLDEDVWQVLQEIDRDRVQQLFAEIQKQFLSEYVIDLAALKDTARAILPLLEAHEETLPYAVWLKNRLDYLDTADEFRRKLPPPKPQPGQPPQPRPNPTPQLQRQVWTEKLAQRPWPPKAKAIVTDLKPVFAAEKVPPELVWIAEVESSFDPRARSPAGAAGLFQLMPATARQYGLRTWPLDQRLKAEPSARAAARHLRYLHGRFDDWRLALAAYNAGEGTVEKLLGQHKEKTFDAIAPRLPAETQMYVPKVEATILRREGRALDRLRATG